METLKVLLIIEPTGPIQIYQNYIMSENENYYSLHYTNSLTCTVRAFDRVTTLGIPSHDTIAPVLISNSSCLMSIRSDTEVKLLALEYYYSLRQWGARVSEALIRVWAEDFLISLDQCVFTPHHFDPMWKKWCVHHTTTLKTVRGRVPGESFICSNTDSYYTIHMKNENVRISFFFHIPKNAFSVAPSTMSVTGA